MSDAAVDVLAWLFLMTTLAVVAGRLLEPLL
jgi:hypothetical protein